MTQFSPLAAANFFITDVSGSRGVEHMKLQKLVYFAHGWWLTAYPQSFLNERPQIWKHGPLFISLYHVLKTFGGSPIAVAQSSNPFTRPDEIPAAENDIRALLGWIWQRYGHLSSFALSDMTHRPGTAWSRVAKERNFSVPRGLEISDEYIREEFLSKSANVDVSREGIDLDGRGTTAA